MQDIPRFISLVCIIISGILNDIYIHVYTMVHTITSSLHSSPTASLSPAAPPVPRSSRRRFNVRSALASFSQFLSMPLSLSLLSFFHSDPARLPPPIVQHPEVELIEPASVASPRAGICSSSSPIPKVVLYWYVTHSAYICIYIMVYYICHGIYHGIYYDIYYGVNYGMYHAPVVYIMHLKRTAAKAHRMLSAFSIFHLEDCPVLSGILNFKSSKSSTVLHTESTDSWCSRSQPSAVKPKRRCCMFHFNAVRWTSISLSYGSSTSGNLYRGGIWSSSMNTGINIFDLQHVKVNGKEDV
jgi:hypothetical protein